MLRRALRVVGDSFCNFRGGSRTIDWWIVAAFVIVNSIVAVNAFLHDPRVGYDRKSHFAYIEALAEFRLVTLEDSEEYFSPPLPYLLPGILVGAGVPLFDAARAGQWGNLGLSIGVTLLLLMAARDASDSSALRLAALAFLGSLPVYYRTFAFIRAEPYLVFFTMLTIYLIVRLQRNDRWDYSGAATLGVILGLALLSRQSGVSLILAVMLFAAWRWFQSPGLRARVSAWLGLTLSIALVVAGWFYWNLWRQQGTVLAFNTDRAPGFSLSNQPLSFYLGIGGGDLFIHPFRPNFEGQFVPVLYSDVWGDYWGYFSVYGRDVRTQTYLSGLGLLKRWHIGVDQGWLVTNFDTMPTFLGRVNRISLYPTLLGLAGAGYGILLAFGWAREPANSPRTRGLVIFLLSALTLTALGYVFALILFPSPLRGDTIKATYVLHIAPCVALLFGLLAARLEQKQPKLFAWMLALLCLVDVHNLPAMITHYPLTGLGG
jgi:4-amino-4-deoxy-L-arabinose transferase-like glycosyltransferase